MGCNPLIAAPTAIPVNAFSESGTSNTRPGNFAFSPAVVPSAPFLYTNAFADDKDVFINIHHLVGRFLERFDEFYDPRRHRGRCIMFLFWDSPPLPQNQYFHRQTFLSLRRCRTMFPPERPSQKRIPHFLYGIFFLPLIRNIFLAIIFIKNRRAVGHVAICDALRTAGIPARAPTTSAVAFFKTSS